MKTNTKYRGFALLVVLIAIAIILMLAAVQMRALFIPAGEPIRTLGTEDRPWVLEEVLVEAGKTVKPPRKEQLPLDAPVTITPAVSLDGSPRGTVTMTFESDGRVRADWQCRYPHGEQDNTLTAKATGNIASKQVFTDAAGQTDNSRLFFVTRGEYQKRTAEPDRDPKTEKGVAWIFGWIGPDQAVEGFISLHPPNREWVAAYALKTAE